MEEASMRDTALSELSEEISVLLNGLEKSNRRAQDLDDIEDKLRSFENNLDALQMELKALGPAEKKSFKRKFKAYKKQLKELKNDHEWKKSNNAKKDLLGDHQAPPQADLNSAGGLIAHGQSVLQDSKESITRSQVVVGQTLEIARATAAKLSEQEKQMQKMYEDLKSIDSALARSNRILKRIGRKMATDKYLWVIIFIVIFFILFIIIWKASGRKSSANTPDVPT